MQCVRCSQPLPPRADRCLRCFALNPQNSPETLGGIAAGSANTVARGSSIGSSARSPAADLSAVARPLEISFQSDPPPARNLLGAMSIHSEPPQESPRPETRSDPGKPRPSPGFELEIPEPELPEFFSKPLAKTLPRDSPALPIAAPEPKPRPPPRRPASPPFPNPFAGTRDDARPPVTESALFASEPELPTEPPIDAPIDPALDPPIDARTQVAARTAPLSSVVHRSTSGQSDPDRDEIPASARLAAWALDFFLIAAVLALFVGLAALQLGARSLAPLGAQSWESWLDGLLFAERLPLFWALLGACIALGYSWLFAALGGRTPGLRALGLKLQREDGRALDPIQALLRAAASLPSAALGLFGFVLALFDPRGQTLHDKLSRSMVVSANARRESR